MLTKKELGIPCLNKVKPTGEQHGLIHKRSILHGITDLLDMASMIHNETVNGDQCMQYVAKRTEVAYRMGYITAWNTRPVNNYHALVEALEFALKNIKKDLSCRLYGGCSAYIQLKNCRGCKAYNDYMAEIDNAKALLATHTQEEAKHGN